MTRIRLAVAAVAVVGAFAFASGAGADVDGGCPPGGGWMLVPDSVGPAAMRVDLQGNDDGWACKTVFVNGSGALIGQVIDNRVQA